MGRVHDGAGAQVARPHHVLPRARARVVEHGAQAERDGLRLRPRPRLAAALCVAVAVAVIVGRWIGSGNGPMVRVVLQTRLAGVLVDFFGREYEDRADFYGRALGDWA